MMLTRRSLFFGASAAATVAALPAKAVKPAAPAPADYWQDDGSNISFGPGDVVYVHDQGNGVMAWTVQRRIIP